MRGVSLIDTNDYKAKQLKHVYAATKNGQKQNKIDFTERKIMFFISPWHKDPLHSSGVNPGLWGQGQQLMESGTQWGVRGQETSV